MKKDKESKRMGYSGIFEKAGTELSKIKKLEKAYDKEFIDKRIDTQDEKEVSKLEYQRGIEKKEYSKQRTKVVTGAIKSKVEAVSGVIEKQFNKPFLGKTSVSVPKYSATNLLKAMGSERRALVREVEPKVVKPENRSLFFKSELNGEVKKDKSWLFAD